MSGTGSWVVDASVALKWVLPEPGTAEARAFLARAGEERATLLAPELLWAEVAGVLWKKATSANGLSYREARAALRVLLRSPIAVVSHVPLADTALQLGLALGITAYDSMYLALAEARDAVLVTFDTRLARRLRSRGFSDRVPVPGGRPADPDGRGVGIVLEDRAESR
jgi:predicted nucleic acid-binding protein